VKKIVLLADDDYDDQQLFAEALQMTDSEFLLHSVSSARDVLAYLNSQEVRQPSLVILDYNMPDQNAAEILALVRSNSLFSTIPVLVWSTSDASIYKKLCMEKGANAYFQKPNSFGELVDTTRQMLTYASR
jgi:CheY-like chemotaxis protein